MIEESRSAAEEVDDGAEWNIPLKSEWPADSVARRGLRPASADTHNIQVVGQLGRSSAPVAAPHTKAASPAIPGRK